MPIEFLCPGCNRRLRVADDFAGKQAVCPECRTAVVIPSAVPPAPQAADSGFGAHPPPRPGSTPGAYREQEPYAFLQNPSYRGTVRRDVANYLVQAILVTIFCCLPFGIVAIVFAAQVSAKLAAGDYAGAVNYSNNARTWCWVSFWVGFVPTVLYLILMAVAGFDILS